MEFHDTLSGDCISVELGTLPQARTRVTLMGKAGEEFIALRGHNGAQPRAASGVRAIHRRFSTTVIGDAPRKAVLNHAHSKRFATWLPLWPQ